MTPIDCPREQDVLDALAAGRWPARCEGELTSHVAGCRACSDLAEVVGALVEAHDALWPEVLVPSAGTVWWRAQLRAKREAARKASWPIAFAQVLGAALASVAAVLLLPAAAPWLSGLGAALPSLPWLQLPAFQLPSFELPSIGVPTLAELGTWRWIAAAAFVTWAVIAPLAVYFAVSDD